MTATEPSHRRAVIGNPSGSFWLYDSHTGFDLTHPPSPTSPITTPAVTLNTTTLPITISPSKSALVIVDMQNFFLSALLGRPTDSKGLQAQTQLLEQAIPAARNAGIRIIWLNWGLTDEDLIDMPAATHRAFGFETVPAADFASYAATSTQQGVVATANSDPQDKHNQAQSEALGKSPHIYTGLGRDMGPITDPSTGKTIQAGRLLFRHTWNASLTPPLLEAYQSNSNRHSQSTNKAPEDTWIHKNRLSGLWGSSQSSPCLQFLETHEIKTLLFAGVNTDQCVGGCITDAFVRGYDVVMLRDACATTSPDCARQAWEFNVEKTLGFVVDCAAFAEGVDQMTRDEMI